MENQYRCLIDCSGQAGRKNLEKDWGRRASKRDLASLHTWVFLHKRMSNLCFHWGELCLLESQEAIHCSGTQRWCRPQELIPLNSDTSIQGSLLSSFIYFRGILQLSKTLFNQQNVGQPLCLRCLFTYTNILFTYTHIHITFLKVSLYLKAQAIWGKKI